MSQYLETITRIMLHLDGNGQTGVYSCAVMEIILQNCLNI